MKDLRERIEDERQGLREYEADVNYGIWRSGGNPDIIDENAVENDFWNQREPDETVRHEIRRQRKRVTFDWL